MLISHWWHPPRDAFCTFIQDTQILTKDLAKRRWALVSHILHNSIILVQFLKTTWQTKGYSVPDIVQKQHIDPLSTLNVKTSPTSFRLFGFSRPWYLSLNTLFKPIYAVTSKSAHVEWDFLQQKLVGAVQVAMQQAASFVIWASFTVQALATASCASWSLWNTHDGHTFSIGCWFRNCYPWPHTIHHYSSNCWPHAGLYWKQRLSQTLSLWPSTPSCQLFIGSWKLQPANVAQPPSPPCCRIEPDLGLLEYSPLSSVPYQMPQCWTMSPFPQTPWISEKIIWILELIDWYLAIYWMGVCILYRWQDTITYDGAQGRAAGTHP